MVGGSFKLSGIQVRKQREPFWPSLRNQCLLHRRGQQTRPWNSSIIEICSRANINPSYRKPRGSPLRRLFCGLSPLGTDDLILSDHLASRELRQLATARASPQFLKANLPADLLCRARALAAIRNERKIDAIIAVAEHINKLGFSEPKHRIVDDPVCELRKLPYIGPITATHLANKSRFQFCKAGPAFGRAISCLRARKRYGALHSAHARARERC
jgi:hypothetical protein